MCVNANGLVDVSKIGGAADLKSSFGAIKFQNVAKGVTVRATNAPVRGTIAGPATVYTTFGAVRLEEIIGDVSVSNNNGRTELTAIHGDADVKGNFGAVVARDVDGGLTVRSKDGGLRAERVNGAIDLSTSFGAIVVESAGGPVTAENSNASITVSGLRGDGCQALNLRTNFGSIQVSLPKSADYDVSARTTFGKIKSEVPITTTLTSDSEIEGRIGQGGCAMSLINRNRSVRIAAE